MDRNRSILWCNDRLSRGFINTQYLYKQSKRNLDFVQRLAIDRKLDVHNGCVNTICWNDVGNLILSGSDDQHLIITYPFTKKVAASIHSGHRANIFSAKFLPNTRDNHIVSCSGDGIICFTNVEREDLHQGHTFDCHLGTAYEVMTVPNDSHTFLSCGEDGTVRWFDLRIKDKCNKSDCREDVMINCRRAVTALGINPLVPYQLAVGCSDSSVRMFDRRMLGTKSTGNYTGRGITGMYSRFTAPNLEGRSHRITSLEFSHDGHEVLVSYSSEYIYLFNMKEDNRFKKLSTKEPVAPPTVEEIEVREKPDPAMTEEEPPPTVTEPSVEPSVEEPEPSTSGGAEGVACSERQPPIKRLRLRGDWSDTGPQARPETGDRPHMSLMQRMSDMLTRWFDENNRRQSTSGEPDEAPGGDNPAEEGTSNEAAAERQDPVADENVEADAAASDSADTAGADEGATSSLPSLRLPVPQGIPESSSSSDSLSSPSTVIAITPCIEKRLVTVDEDIAEEQSQQDSSTSDNTESTAVHTVSENITSDSGSSDLKDDMAVSNGALPHDQTGTEPVVADTVVPSPTGEETASSSTLEVLETINNEVSSIRDRIITTDVEPVISLEYSSEGTTASTIKVGFTPSEGVVDIDSEPMQSSGNSNVSPVSLHGAKTDESEQSATDVSQSGACAMEDATASDSSCLSPTLSTQQLVTQDHSADNSTAAKPVCAKSEESELGAWEAVSAFNMRLVSESSPEQDASVASADDRGLRSCDSKTDELMEDVDIQVKDSVSNSSGLSERSLASLDAKAAKKSGSAGRKGDVSPMEQGSDVTTSEYLSAMDTDGSKEPSIAGDVPGSEVMGEDGKVEAEAERSDGCDMCVDSAETDDGAKAVESDNPEGASANVEGAEEDEDDPSAGASGSQGTRQRRIGYSGPPTGNFQLFSPTEPPGDDSDDESDDDDEDVGTRRIRREGGRWTTASAVARRLQRMYRKKQEAKQREEEAMRNVHEPSVKNVFKGHRNARTMIKEANFWGDNYVMSGSDCGHIFIWDRYTAELVMLLEADKHVVNCLQPHPFYPVLASSGIDYDVKIWSPVQRDVGFDLKSAEEVTKRNEVMLEETRDTITVPASFMLRMLASLNNIRTGRREERQNEESSSGED